MTETKVLVIGTGKTGTTVISKTIQAAIPGAAYLLEPRTLNQIESMARDNPHAVVKILHPHWAKRPNLLTALAMGETEFHPTLRIAIVRDPRDRLVSALMYKPYNFVLRGAGEQQVADWIAALEEKERNPASLTLTALIERMNAIFSRDVTLEKEFTKYDEYENWLHPMRDAFHVVRYEDFVDGNVAALEHYLNVKLPQTRDVGGLSRVRRTSSHGNWKDFVLADDLPEMQRLAGRRTAEYGYDDWSLPAAPSLSPEFGSLYARRITNEARAMREQAAPENAQAPRAKRSRFF